VAATRRHLELHGCPEDVLESVFSAFATLVDDVHPAAASRLIGDGDVLVAAGESWRVIPVPGHADGQIALFGTRSRRLLAADAILARIAPFVGVHPVSRPDPLGDHLAQLERLARLDAVIAYPGHFDPITDVAGWPIVVGAHVGEQPIRALDLGSGERRRARRLRPDRLQVQHERPDVTLDLLRQPLHALREPGGQPRCGHLHDGHHEHAARDDAEEYGGPIRHRGSSVASGARASS
jgi:glyoxylase-like metal-dependent hydrolase (beta-lactamase superfamily II)